MPVFSTFSCQPWSECIYDGFVTEGGRFGLPPSVYFHWLSIRWDWRWQLCEESFCPILQTGLKNIKQPDFILNRPGSYFQLICVDYQLFATEGVCLFFPTFSCQPWSECVYDGFATEGGRTGAPPPVYLYWFDYQTIATEGGRCGRSRSSHFCRPKDSAEAFVVLLLKKLSIWS